MVGDWQCKSEKCVKTLLARGNKYVWAQQAELVKQAEWVGWLQSKVCALNQSDRWRIAGLAREEM